jgi:phenylalanine-4-hydroxylase
MKQIMTNYTSTDKLVWRKLFERQMKNLETKGSQVYLDCLQDMNAILNPNQIPDFKQINDWFKTTTGWEIEVVPGLIPVDDFFDLLAEKRFCSSTWLRSMEQLDYLEEPDMFHDIFGHIPLLSNPEFSAFAQEFGKLGQAFKGDPVALIKLQRLYWFTIEFGVINENGINKSYGAGIMSSFGETNRVANQDCTILPFEIETVLNKFFESDSLQQDYFLIHKFDELKEALQATNVLLSRKISY